MELHLTSEQEAFIRQGIEAGRFQGKEDAVQEAMSLWEERERRRLEILAAVEQAEASLARGEGRRITTHEVLRVSSTLRHVFLSYRLAGMPRRRALLPGPSIPTPERARLARSEHF